MIRIFIILLLSLSLLACTSSPSLTQTLELAQTKRQYEAGYLKKAKENLLPLATAGNAEAQYALGYMYYYGYGTTQDIESVYFWIKKAANQKYEPAIKALKIIS